MARRSLFRLKFSGLSWRAISPILRPESLLVTVTFSMSTGGKRSTISLLVYSLQRIGASPLRISSTEERFFCVSLLYIYINISASLIELVIETLEDATLFLRTVQEDLEVPCPIRHLHFVNLGNDSTRYDFRRIASIIVTQCTHIKILEAEADALSFSSFTELPELPELRNLRQLRVDYQGVDDIALLLSLSPNLEMLEARHLVRKPNASTLNNIPRPTFRLRRLRLSQCNINMDQYRWLLSSSSDSVEFLKLQEMNELAGAVANVIHDSVLALHLEAHAGNTMTRIIPSFGNLTSLRIGGDYLPWDSVFQSIAAPLQSITIPYSEESIRLVSRLRDLSWLPKLESVTMYHYLDRLEVDGSQDDRRDLESVCESRCVELRWITVRNGDWSETE